MQTASDDLDFLDEGCEVGSGYVFDSEVMMAGYDECVEGG